jgi:hypothetical protein
LTAIFVEYHIVDPVQAVLDAPMAAIERQELTGRGACRIEIGDAVGSLGARGAAFDGGDLSFDQADLADVGKIQVVVECGGGTEGALFYAPVALINGDVLRGG